MKECLQIKILHKILAKNKIFKTEDNIPADKLQENTMRNKNVFCIFKVSEERTRIRIN